MSRRRRRAPRRPPGPSPPTPPAPIVGPRFRALAPAAAVFGLLVLAVYARVLTGPFVYDDVIIARSSLLHITTLSEVWDILAAKGVPRKVGLATFALSFLAGRLDPFGYHLVSLALHVANGLVLSCFVFMLLRLVAAMPAGRAPAPPLAALAGTAVWLVHPVHTQAVSYIYQRYTLLCAFFYLSALVAYVSARLNRGRRRIFLYSLAALAGLLALGSKENAGSLPVFVLLVEVLLLRRDALRFDRRLAARAAAALAALALVSWFFLGPRWMEQITRESLRRGFTPAQRVLTELRVVVDYLALLAFPYPSRLNLDYDFPLSRSLIDPPTTLACLALLAGAAAVAFSQVQARPLAAFAILWFLGQLAIESSFIPLDLAYEHRLYLPSTVPVALAVAWLWQRVPWPLLARAAALAAWVALWGVWSFQRNRVWTDPVALFEDNAAKSPGKARVHGNLGKAYLDRGRYEEARQSFERAVALDPQIVGAYNNLAVIYLDHVRDWDKARAALEKVLSREPAHVESLVNLGVLELRLHRPEQALRPLQKALEVEPSSRGGLYNLGAAYLDLGLFDRSIEVLTTGVRYWPADARFHALLGLDYLQKRDRPRAEAAFQAALRIDPGEPTAKHYLARLR